MNRMIEPLDCSRKFVNERLEKTWSNDEVTEELFVWVFGQSRPIAKADRSNQSWAGIHQELWEGSPVSELQSKPPLERDSIHNPILTQRTFALPFL